MTSQHETEHASGNSTDCSLQSTKNRSHNSGSQIQRVRNIAILKVCQAQQTRLKDDHVSRWSGKQNSVFAKPNDNR